MDLFQWRQNYLVHLPEIDAEHENLFRLGRQLCESIASGTPQPQLEPMFRDLVEAAAGHFSHEERLMRNAGYPSRAWHVRSHDVVRKRAAGCLPWIAEGDLDASKELLTFLDSWFQDHAGVHARLMAC